MGEGATILDYNVGDSYKKLVQTISWQNLKSPGPVRFWGLKQLQHNRSCFILYRSTVSNHSF